jgi:hypothetical protein
MLRTLFLRSGKIVQFCPRKNQRYSLSLSRKFDVLKYIQELRDGFYELAEDRPGPTPIPVPKVATTSTKGKGKPRLEKKTSDDPFASDNEDSMDSKFENDKPATSKSRPKRSHDDDDEGEEEVKPKKKRIT